MLSPHTPPSLKEKQQSAQDRLCRTLFTLEGTVLGTESCPPPNSQVEVPTPNVTSFGDGAFKEVIKFREGHKPRALILQD